MAEQGDDETGRDETEVERLDRNWNDILQELRVMQTGTQLIAGFLLTLPFASRFTELDRFEETLYLGLVLIAGLTLVLMLTPISIHRRLFGEHVKDRLVSAAHRLMVVALAMVGLLITGNIALIFHVVVGSGTAFVVGSAVLAMVIGLLLVVPIVIHPRRES